MTTTAETLDQLRQHFNQAPYPNQPLEKYPDDANDLYDHSLVTAYYRCYQQVIQPEGRVILDAGCGTGYKSLVLALANPGAKIVGVDLSEDSIVMAKQRLEYHQVGNCEFHAMALEDVAQLGIQFDYINCDDVLYLVPDPIAALSAMRSVLTPQGIIRANYHSATGRRFCSLSQSFFKTLGCMQGPPQQEEIALVRQTMEALRPEVTLVRQVWGKAFLEHDELVLANHLLQNDKTWSMVQFFDALEVSGLEFASMVDWWTWNLADLFRDLEALPIEVVMRLSELSLKEQLALYETINHRHRLLDLWMTLPGQPMQYVPMDEWSDETWYGATVHLHPQLVSEKFRNDLVDCAGSAKMLNTAGYLRTTTPEPATVFLDTLMTGCLLPLLDQGMDFQDVLNRWLHLRPINPVTMQPTTPEEAFYPLQQILLELARIGYVLLEPGN